MPLGCGKAAAIPSQLLGSCKGRGLWMQLTPAEGRSRGLPDVEGGFQMWAALERELDWRRAAPCRESEPGVSPPRLQHQLAMLLPPSSPLSEPSSLGIHVFLWGGVVEADGFQHTPFLGSEGSPCFRGISPQPPLGHPGLGFPNPHSPCQA